MELMTNKAAMAGGDSIVECETSMPRGLGDSDTIMIAALFVISFDIRTG
jgi:hypothetical protein